MNATNLHASILITLCNYREEIYLLEQTYRNDEELDEFSDEEVPPDSAGVVGLTDCDTSPALQPGNVRYIYTITTRFREMYTIADFVAV